MTWLAEKNEARHEPSSRLVGLCSANALWQEARQLWTAGIGSLARRIVFDKQWEPKTLTARQEASEL